jgi:hypothetical protein
MKLLLSFIILFTLSANGQKLPQVNFNHFYLVIDSSDISAIQKSEFIKNKFASLILRTTKGDSVTTWTGIYLFGLDNYFEIFDSNGIGEPPGNAGIGLSVDGIGEINQLDTFLAKKYKTETTLRVRQLDREKIPWFNELDIIDSSFFSQSHIFLWVMEYRPEYFDYNHWKYNNNKLMRATCLDQYAEERKDKILKRFTGITLRTTTKEKIFLSNFLLNCGYKQIDQTSFASPDNFVFHFINRNKNEHYSVAYVEFKSKLSRNGTEKISDNIQIVFHNTTGKIFFK